MKFNKLQQARIFDIDTGKFYHIGRDKNDKNRRAVLTPKYYYHTTDSYYVIDPLTKARIIISRETIESLSNPIKKIINEKRNLDVRNAIVNITEWTYYTFGDNSFTLSFITGKRMTSELTEAENQMVKKYRGCLDDVKRNYEEKSKGQSRVFSNEELTNYLNSFNFNQKLLYKLFYENKTGFKDCIKKYLSKLSEFEFNQIVDYLYKNRDKILERYGYSV